MRGGTDPATNVRATQARLHAHGNTNDGPAEWWWVLVLATSAESSGGTRACGTEPDGRCGPTSSAAQVNLSTLVTGLTPDTTYYPRAAARTPTTRRRPAPPSSASGRPTRTRRPPWPAASSPSAPPTASPTNAFASRRFIDTGGVARYQLEDLVSTTGRRGTSIVAGRAARSIPRRPIDDAVTCPVAGVTRVRALLADGNDRATTDNSVTVPSTLDGGAGQDRLRGGDNADDTIITGPGGDLAVGGEEVLYRRRRERHLRDAQRRPGRLPLRQRARRRERRTNEPRLPPRGWGSHPANRVNRAPSSSSARSYDARLVGGSTTAWTRLRRPSCSSTLASAS